MKWRPIETAPKDGTLILVWDKDGAEVTVVSYSEVNDCWLDCISAEDGDGVHGVKLSRRELIGWRCYCPTHWMPLPEPPNGS